MPAELGFGMLGNRQVDERVEWREGQLATVDCGGGLEWSQEREEKRRDLRLKRRKSRRRNDWWRGQCGPVCSSGNLHSELIEIYFKSNYSFLKKICCWTYEIENNLHLKMNQSQIQSFGNILINLWVFSSFVGALASGHPAVSETWKAPISTLKRQ